MLCAPCNEIDTPFNVDKKPKASRDGWSEKDTIQTGDQHSSKKLAMAMRHNEPILKQRLWDVQTSRLLPLFQFKLWPGP